MHVRTSYETGKSTQLAMEMDENGVEILGLSKVRWTASGKVTPVSGHVLV